MPAGFAGKVPFRPDFRRLTPLAPPAHSVAGRLEG